LIASAAAFIVDFMTVSPDVAESTRTPRSQRLRHYAMTPPTYFAVDYAINPWMDTSTPVDARLALAQWENLRVAYLRLGRTVELVAPRTSRSGDRVRDAALRGGIPSHRRRPV
jgi:hypothetical protein